MPLRTYVYRPDVLDRLWKHGVQPRASTPPDLVYGFVKDLYRYQLRRLRDRLKRGDFPKAGYFGRVVELRRAYPLLSLSAHEWLVGGPPRAGVPE